MGRFVDAINTFIHSRKCTAVLVIIGLFLPLYGEYFTYSLYKNSWPSLSDSATKNDQNTAPTAESMRILFVADCQLLGAKNEYAWLPPLAWLTKWDADRYLRRTYLDAYHHHKPEVVVFLGDILDEGSVANDDDEDYRTYATRFLDIFHKDLPYKEIRLVYVPGDNDIGGEGNDKKEEWKVKRFENYFGDETGVMRHKFVDFVWKNSFYGENETEEALDNLMDVMYDANAKYRLLLTHMPLLLHRNKAKFRQLYDVTKPRAIFSAHFHHAMAYVCQNCEAGNMDDVWKGYRLQMHAGNIYELDLNNNKELDEITVPASSYRQGVVAMGYGAAVINSNGRMKYTLLALPERYRLLYAYLTLIITTIVVIQFRSNVQPPSAREKKQKKNK